MKVFRLHLLLWLGCGVVGHERDVGEKGEGGQIPVYEKEYIQDTVEELERKWSFEVCFLPVILFLHLNPYSASLMILEENSSLNFCSILNPFRYIAVTSIASFGCQFLSYKWVRVQANICV